MQRLRTIFASFFKIGLFTFGGGYAMLPLIEQELIAKAKALLMERNNMTEAEAHRYIQKCSMDSGTNLVETAQMVISLIHV